MARKSRDEVQRERQHLLAIIRENPSGLNHDEIRRLYLLRAGASIPYSTLRVRLQQFETEGLVLRPKRRRNLRYQPADQPSLPATGGALEHPDNSTKPEAGHPAGLLLTSEAHRALQRVRQPRAQKKLVGYESRFLDDYEPGVTWYLPVPLRERLLDLGRTSHLTKPAGTYARDIMQRLVIDLSWGSSRLEGLKHSRIDTAELLAGSGSLSAIPPVDRQLILNHKAAIEFLVENAQEIGFNRFTMFGLHALLSENLLENREEEGRLRHRPVNVGTSVYTPPAIPQVIEERFDKLLRVAHSIPDPFEQAFFAMVQLPYLQPFIDVNKRTSRLAANIPLIRENLCPLSFIDVPEGDYVDGLLAVYELNDISLLRDVFTWAYQRSCAQFRILRDAMGQPDPIRLNYRTELRALVAEIVRSQDWPESGQLLRSAGAYGVNESDALAFVGAVERDLESLRPDILPRYSLRLSEYEAWAKAIERSFPGRRSASHLH